jgi:hypothetical protein
LWWFPQPEGRRTASYWESRSLGGLLTDLNDLDPCEMLEHNQINFEGKKGRVGTPETQLASFLAKYTPEIAALAEAILNRMRELYPTAVEIVYDN